MVMVFSFVLWVLIGFIFDIGRIFSVKDFVFLLSGGYV